jgi:hypothetical protein
VTIHIIEIADKASNWGYTDLTPLTEDENKIMNAHVKYLKEMEKNYKPTEPIEFPKLKYLHNYMDSKNHSEDEMKYMDSKNLSEEDMKYMSDKASNWGYTDLTPLTEDENKIMNAHVKYLKEMEKNYKLNLLYFLN